MRYGSRDMCKGEDGIIFLDVGLKVVAFEKKVGEILPDNCENIFDVCGPFIMQRGHYQNDMVFLFGENCKDKHIKKLKQWILEKPDVVLVSDYLEDVPESEEDLTSSTVEAEY